MSETPQGSEDAAAPLRARGGVQAGGESILVVEDHPALRELIRTFLADEGYAVTAVGGPGEAEAAWDRETGGFDLLITDLVMPEKGGRALAEGLRARKPSLRTLYISGHAQGVDSGRQAEEPYLQKPFTRGDLLQMARSLFAGQGSRTAAK